MKLLLIWLLLAQDFRQAVPGYVYAFPKDHFAHPEFQTEWWYYTGNLKSASGRHYGFELSFFRQAVDRKPAASPWSVNDVYLAHLALSDLDGNRFLHEERVNRAGPGLAGVKAPVIWNGNWSLEWTNEIHLNAVAAEFALDLHLALTKPPVIHGVNGVSQKAPGLGHASHYISLTRLEVNGRLDLDRKAIAVTGTAWMDHEFFTHQLDPNQTGWDWMSLQLDDHTELMLFRLRRRDGSLDPYSAGTYTDAKGIPRHLSATDFTLKPGRQWKAYHVEWQIAIPSLGFDAKLTTKLDSQELSANSLTPAYWEGAINIAGVKQGKPITGVGYLEMTGQDKPIDFGK